MALHIPVPTRPQMPEGYGLGDAERFKPIEWKWVEAQLDSARNYWIATTSASGAPHVVPVWGLWLNQQFMFATDAASSKARNAARNPACSVHLESGDDVVILNGTLHRETGPGAIAAFNAAYEPKYSIDPGSGGDDAPVYTLGLKSVLAWIESDFPGTATRWRFRQT